MKKQASGRKALKLAFMAFASLVAFALKAATLPAPRCSQGSYTTYVVLTWTTYSDVDGYKVFRGLNKDFNLSDEILTINASDVSTLKDYGVKPGTKYYYWVCPFIGSDVYLSGSAVGYARKPVLNVPSVSAGTYQGYIKVTWKAVSDADAYRLYYSTTKTRYADYFLDYDVNDRSGQVIGMPPLKKYYFWLGARVNGFWFVSGISKQGWRKKVLTVYTPKLVRIPSDASTGMSWWATTLSGDFIVPSKATLTCSVKKCASFTKYGAVDETSTFCGDITGKKNGKAYITIQHSKLKVKSKAITIIKDGFSSSSASAS